MAADTVVNTGAEGGPDAENGDTGQTVYGDAVRTTINKNGRQIVAAEGTANTTVVYAGGDQTVHGSRTGYHAEWGVPVCAQRRYGVWHCCKQ
ncbi:antigen 43, truncation [Escherichia coli]|nr:antigen 43, truncation [Escherichia coli]